MAEDDLLAANAGFLFSNLVLTSAAVKTNCHDRWLNNIGAAERIYVNINQRDTVLTLASFAFKPNMLGRDLQPPGATSTNVTYVDVSACNINRRYFVPQGQKKHPGLRTLYQQLVTGSEVSFNEIATPDRLNGIDVHRLMG